MGDERHSEGGEENKGVWWAETRQREEKMIVRGDTGTNLARKERVYHEATRLTNRVRPFLDARRRLSSCRGVVVVAHVEAAVDGGVEERANGDSSVHGRLLASAVKAPGSAYTPSFMPPACSRRADCWIDMSWNTLDLDAKRQNW